MSAPSDKVALWQQEIARLQQGIDLAKNVVASETSRLAKTEKELRLLESEKRELDRAVSASSFISRIKTLDHELEKIEDEITKIKNTKTEMMEKLKTLQAQPEKDEAQIQALRGELSGRIARLDVLDKRHVEKMNERDRQVQRGRELVKEKTGINLSSNPLSEAEVQQAEITGSNAVKKQDLLQDKINILNRDKLQPNTLRNAERHVVDLTRKRDELQWTLDRAIEKERAAKEGRGATEQVPQIFPKARRHAHF